MQITVIGAGYVGLVTSLVFADCGHNVICLDCDKSKIARLQQGDLPIYEQNIGQLLKKLVISRKLQFTSDMTKAIQDATICFLAVGTPQNAEGGVDMSYVETAAAEIGKYMTHPLCVVDKSTVPVGTTRVVRKIIQEQLNKRGISISFEVVSNPEFLREGSAYYDFIHPDRVVLGADSKAALNTMVDLYKCLIAEDKIITMDTVSAEFTKYAANAMLACRISFMNEMANLCEAVGANIDFVKAGIGSDSRIGSHFLNAGCGYGGSCFPKDVRALTTVGRIAGVECFMLEAIEKTNQRQKKVLLDKIFYLFDKNLTGMTFGIWGLSFKANTDDTRESIAIHIVKELIGCGAKVKAYDPKAMEKARLCFAEVGNAVTFVKDKYEAAIDADGLLLLTEWKEFQTVDFNEIKNRMRNAIIIDGRNFYSRKQLQDLGFTYISMGR